MRAHRVYLGGTSRGGGLRYLALMCKKGFFGEVWSAMVASSDRRMLSSMAACVRPATGPVPARLMLLVLPCVSSGRRSSLTGVEARLWLRTLRAALSSVGVLAILADLPFLGWANFSAPKHLVSLFAMLILLDFLGVVTKAFEVRDLRSSVGVRFDLPVGVLGVL